MSRQGSYGLLAALLLAIGFAGPAHAKGGSLVFHATLTGEQEVPEVESRARAEALAQFDRGFTRLRVAVDIRGPITVVAAHFHCGRPGTNGPVAFGILNPGLLVEIGNRVRVTLDNSAFTGADCTPIVGRPVNNLAALALAMRDGLIYINLHSPEHQLGEIRDQMLELGR